MSGQPQVDAEALAVDRHGRGDVMSNKAVLLPQIPRDKVALDEARHRLRQTVRRAHEAGATWAEIGKALGVSRQAAWERFHSE